MGEHVIIVNAYTHILNLFVSKISHCHTSFYKQLYYTTINEKLYTQLEILYKNCTRFLQVQQLIRIYLQPFRLFFFTTIIVMKAAFSTSTVQISMIR